MFCCAAAEGQQVELLVESQPENVEPAAEPAAEPSTQEELAPPEPELPKGKPVQVLVVGARGLRNADWAPGSGKSDAFVTVDFAGGSGGFSTPVIHDSLEPVWQHEGELAHVPDGATLQFTVWDKDPVGKDLLGKAQLPASQYEAHGFNGELQLTEAGAGIKAYLKIKVKVPGKSYPSGVGTSFAVDLEKPMGTSLGLDVDVLDGTTLQICGTKPGAVETYNRSHAATPELMLTAGLYIMSVNGVSNSASEMITRLKEDTKFSLQLRRPQVFPVTIAKKAGVLGLDLNYAATGIALLVLKVNDGPVADWNGTHQDQEVKKNDRIMSVNGVTGSTKDLYEAIKNADKLQLIISRPASDSWWALL